MNVHEREVLHAWIQAHGLELSEERIELLDLFLSELWEWNKKVNLTGVASRERIILELLLDSLLPSLFLPEEGTVLDIGSGAGFPSLPLKMCRPRLEFHLVEANFKKTVFLKQVIRRAGLQKILVIHGRIEGVVLPRKNYPFITSRAMSALRQTLKMGLPHLAGKGSFITYLGSHVHSELDEVSDLLEEEGLEIRKVLPYTIPGKKGSRHLVVIARPAAPPGKELIS